MIIELPKSHEPLLSQVEKQGVQTNAQCRQGFCGACRCKLVKGEVEYVETPLAFVADNEVLLCCSVAKSQVEVEIE